MLLLGLVGLLLGTFCGVAAMGGVMSGALPGASFGLLLGYGARLIIRARRMSREFCDTPRAVRIAFRLRERRLKP